MPHARLFFWYTSGPMNMHLHHYLVMFPCTYRLALTIQIAAYLERRRTSLGSRIVSMLEAGAPPRSLRVRRLSYRLRCVGRATAWACAWARRTAFDSLSRAVERHQVADIIHDWHPATASSISSRNHRLLRAARHATQAQVSVVDGDRARATTALPEYLF